MRGTTLKILHLTSSDRWTGAAAPAYTEVEALRAHGVDALFGYVGGYTLEEKVSTKSFTRRMIDKQQNPYTFASGIQRVRDAVEREGIDILHAHLTYDHWVAVFAAKRSSVRVVRTFHALRPLRDPLATPYLLRSTSAVGIVNLTFASHSHLRRKSVVFTPPPVDESQFFPQGENVRREYGFDHSIRIIGVIGKVSPGRGFEEALKVFALLNQRDPSTRLLIIGRGPHRPFLESMSKQLGIADKVVWAGYHEERLAHHYRAMDLMLFTATGSDEGHHAVSEAMACGTPVVCYPIPGIGEIVGRLEADLVASAASTEVLAERALSLLPSRAAALRPLCVAEATRFGFQATAERLQAAYQAVLSGAQ